MDPRVLPIAERMKTVVFANDEHSTFEDLLNLCPDLALSHDKTGKNDLWRDLKKKATPVGARRSLKYDMKVLNPLVEKERQFLLEGWVVIRAFLRVVSVTRHKGLLLSVLRYWFNRPFSTGGGTPDATRRVLLIFEKEGGYRPRTNSASSETSSAFTSSASEDSQHQLDDFQLDLSDFDFEEEHEDESWAKRARWN